jgi:hypothetical protein
MRTKEIVFLKLLTYLYFTFGITTVKQRTILQSAAPVNNVLFAKNKLQKICFDQLQKKWHIQTVGKPFSFYICIFISHAKITLTKVKSSF